MDNKRLIMAKNLIFGAIWAAVACLNAYVITTESEPDIGNIMICVLDMLMSRIDIVMFWCAKTGTHTSRVTNPTMNRYGMLAAVGAGIYIPINAAELAQGRISIICIASLLFLMVATYTLSIKSRCAK